MPNSERSGTTIFDFATDILQHRRALVVLVVMCTFGAAGLTLLGKRQYASTTSFAPRSQDARSGLGAVAAQLGISVPSAEASQSPDFFGDLLRSPEILGPIVDSGYVTGGHRVDLATAFDVKATEPRVRRVFTMNALTQAITADRNGKTGVVTATVRTSDPQLAYQIALALLREINAFNLRTRQDRAAAEVKFVEQRLAVLRVELREAEDQLLAFRLGNRGALAPALETQQQRLEREVALRQQVFGALSQAYEQARIDAVRNTPVITVVQRPEVPVLPQSRHLAMRLILGMLVGLMLFTFYVLLARVLAAAKDKDPASYARFHSLWPFAKAKHAER